MTGQTPFQDGATAQLQLDQNGVGEDAGVMSVPTTGGGTVLTVTNVTTLGWIVLTNLDLTNFVTYGPTSGGAIVALGKLKPSETAILRLKPGVTLRLLADTAAAQVAYKLFQD